MGYGKTPKSEHYIASLTAFFSFSLLGKIKRGKDVYAAYNLIRNVSLKWGW